MTTLRGTVSAAAAGSLKFTTAFERLIPSSENASTNSASDIFSRSFLGDQPSRQRKLMKASERNPASRYVVTLTTGPWRRLESLVPSGATSSGR